MMALSTAQKRERPSNGSIATPKLEPREFELLRQLILDCCGIRLSDKKAMLVQNRIGKRLRALELSSFREYNRLFETEAGLEAELPHLWSAITTNHTRFFREAHHFDILRRDLLPRLVRKKGAGFLRVWSAGCATGQEVYTLAMVLDEWCRRNSCQYKIMGSDIDQQALAVARAGVYSRECRKEIPGAHAMRHLTLGPETLQINDDLKKNVSWCWHNFATVSPLRPRVDLIFCRNAIMYLHTDTRRRLAEVFHESLLPGGVLLLGSSESLHGLPVIFESERIDKTLIYRKGGRGG